MAPLTSKVPLVIPGFNSYLSLWFDTERRMARGTGSEFIQRLDKKATL